MKTNIVYVTSNEFKIQENEIFQKVYKLKNGKLVSDCFTFEFRNVPIIEMLEVDLKVIVQAEVTKAYSQIKVPCIVEHAGLIFAEYLDRSYPGGLTKPMWNTLGDRFIQETGSSGRKAIARAVVAYCDGKSVRTFVGETKGTIAEKPRGGRKFYWDTVFIPEDKGNVKTYAEIIDDPNLGLEYKVEHLSQSSKAMLNFLEFIMINPKSDLWK
jgi:inosine/xanthosine triphosphate pyrophosphatase family protein